MDIARLLRERLRKAFEAGHERAGGTNVAAAVNINGKGHVTSVYSDQDVTIVQRDDEIEVIRHRQREEPAGDE